MGAGHGGGRRDDRTRLCGGASTPSRVDGERHDVRFELRQSQTGKPAGVAFTTVAKLVGQLGRHQPWVVLRTDGYRELLARASVSSIMLDPEVDPRTVQWSAEAVDLLAKANNGWI